MNDCLVNPQGTSHCFHADPNLQRGSAAGHSGTNGVCCWCGTVQFHKDRVYVEPEHGPFKP